MFIDSPVRQTIGCGTGVGAIIVRDDSLFPFASNSACAQLSADGCSMRAPSICIGDGGVVQSLVLWHELTIAAVQAIMVYKCIFFIEL